MITLQDLFLYCQEVLRPNDFTDYCPNGIQVEGKKEIRKLCFAVSASLAAIEETVKRKGDALIVHHGVFWNKDPYPVVGTKRKKLAHLLQEEISLLAYHLPLDAHPAIGNNWKAALDLGMEDLELFSLIGVKGKVPEMKVEQFQKKLEEYYGHKAFCALGGPQTICSAAIISGGAHRSLSDAADSGVNCFITGSFDEPMWDIAHERGVHFFALGHYATERVGILALMALLEEQFGIPCEFIDLFNPF